MAKGDEIREFISNSTISDDLEQFMLGFVDLLIPSPPRLTRIPNNGRPRPLIERPKPSRGSNTPTAKKGSTEDSVVNGKAPGFTRPKPKLIEALVNRIKSKG